MEGTNDVALNRQNYIDNLPVEIMRMIFAGCLPSSIYLVRDTMDVALLLSQVSHRWREIAINFPDLWSAISIRWMDYYYSDSDDDWTQILEIEKDMESSLYNYYTDDEDDVDMHAHKSKDDDGCDSDDSYTSIEYFLRPHQNLLQLWLRRSNPMPLIIEYGDGLLWNRDIAILQDTLQARWVMRMLFQESHRLHSLSLNVAGFCELPEANQALSLRRLSLLVEYDFDSLYMAVEPDDLIFQFATIEPIIRLCNLVTHLSMSVALLPHDVISVLSFLSNTLEYCSVINITDIDPEDIPDKTMPTSPVGLPRLISLRLGSKYASGEEIAESPHFYVLECIATPSLVELELYKTVGFCEESIQSWCKNSQCQLKRLSFTATLDWEDIMPTWGGIGHSLEYLHLDSFVEPSGTFPLESLTEGLRFQDPSGRLIYCPNLQVISYDIDDEWINQTDSEDNSLTQDTLIARRLRAPLRTLRKIRITSISQQMFTPARLLGDKQVEYICLILQSLGMWGLYLLQWVLLPAPTLSFANSKI